MAGERAAVSLFEALDRVSSSDAKRVYGDVDAASLAVLAVSTTVVERSQESVSIFSIYLMCEPVELVYRPPC